MIPARRLQRTLLHNLYVTDGNVQRGLERQPVMSNLYLKTGY